MPRHVLLLTDRDWTHPQGGGTGTNLYGQVARWLAWGHRVTVIAGDYPGAAKVEHLSDRLTIHRMGTRLTVFPRAAWAVWRGVGRDADVVLEVVNGIAFFTPLWWFLRAPRVALVHHVHQDHYVARARAARARSRRSLLERLPLQLPLPRRARSSRSRRPRATTSSSSASRPSTSTSPTSASSRRSSTPARARRAPDAALPRPAEALQAHRGPARRARGASPRRVLEIAGDGDHRAALEAEIDAPRPARPRDAARPRRRGRRRPTLYGRAWVNLTASSAEGWCLTRDGGRGLRHAERGAARRRAAGVDRRRQTGLLADDARGAGRRACAALVARPGAARRARRGGRGARAQLHVGAHRRGEPRRCWTDAADGGRQRLRDAVARVGDRQGRGPGRRDARQQRAPADLHVRLHAPARRRRLRLAGGARLRVPDPARRRPVGAGGGGARDRRSGRHGRRGARQRRRCARGRGGWSSCSSARSRSSIAAARADRRTWSACPSIRGRRRRSCPPACSGCCSRCSAARCRGCTPTSRSRCSLDRRGRAADRVRR